MALRQLVVSDISGKDIPDEKHARVVINGHPSISGSVELDISTDEAGKLQSSSLNLINLTVYAPNERPRQVVIEADAFNTAFGKNVDMETVLKSARRSSASSDGAPKQRRARGTGAPKGDKVDYTSPEHFGQLHRGRVTEAEQALVRENRDQASRNRQAQTGKPIDFDDPNELKRYGM